MALRAVNISLSSHASTRLPVEIVMMSGSWECKVAERRACPRSAHSRGGLGAGGRHPREPPRQQKTGSRVWREGACYTCGWGRVAANCAGTVRVRGGIPGGRGASASALPPGRGVMHLAGKLEYSMARQLGVHSTYLIRSESTLANFCSESHR